MYLTLNRAHAALKGEAALTTTAWRGFASAGTRTEKDTFGPIEVDPYCPYLPSWGTPWVIP